MALIRYLKGLSIDGNVGIGTTAPNAKLDIQGSQGQLFSVTDSLSGSIFAVSDISGVPILDVNSSGTSYFSGNVGIGTSTPAQKLHIVGERLRLDGTHIEMNPTSASTSYLSSGTNTTNFFIRNRDAGVLTFGTSDLERMRITSGGNVGIGTTSPGYPLDIVGFANSSSGFRVTDGTIDNRMSWSSGNIGFFGTISNHPIAFNTNSIERMRIGSGGNVGIGITAPTTKLHVVGQDITFYSDTAEQSLQVGRNANERTEIFINDLQNKITAINDADNNDPHKFILNRAFLGTGANTFEIQKDGSVQLLIDTSGNVGIGTTAPADRLDLYDSDDNVGMYFHTATSGTGGGNGLRVGQNNANAFVWNYEATPLSLATSGTARLTINATGGVRFNTGYGAGTLVTDASGNITVSSGGGAGGPYLPLAGGTLTGALTGTTATFSEKLTLNSANYADHLAIRRGVYGYDTVVTGTRVDFSPTASTDTFRFLANVQSTGTVTSPTFLGDLNGTINTVTTAVTKANATNDTTVATTAFVQNLIGTIPAGLVFQGTWNAATNTPTLTSGSGTTGHFYIVSTSGSTNLDGVTDWVTGDWAVFIEQGGTDAWEKIDNSSVLDGAGTGQTVALWSGSGTSNTLTDAPITVSGNNTTFAGNVTAGSNSVQNGANPGLKVTSTNTSQTVLLIDNTTSRNYELAVGGSASGIGAGKFYVYDGTAAAVRLSIDTSGNVGIGTTNPGQKLEVIGNVSLGISSTTTRTALLTNTFGYSSGWKTLTLGSTGTNYQTDAVSLCFNVLLNQNSSGSFTGDGSELFFRNIAYFKTPNSINNGYLNLLTFNNGNVGIGLTDPDSKLDINAGVTNITAGPAVRISKGASPIGLIRYDTVVIEANDVATIRIGESDGTVSSIMSGDNNLRINSTDPIKFYTAGTTTGEAHAGQGGSFAMIIDNSQNVGIGTTSPDAKLEVAGGTTGILLSNLGDSSAYDAIRMTYNGYNSGTPEFIFEPKTAPGSGTVNSYFRFQTKPNGGAAGTGNVANITVDGKVGVGTTNPASKLQVAGGIQMADDSDAAAATKVGTMRYRTGTEYVEVDGVELVTNGDFAVDANWGNQTGTSWSISGGTANVTAFAGTTYFQQSGVLPSSPQNKSFLVTWTISNLTAGTIGINVGGYITTTLQASNGTYQEVVTPTNASTNTILYIQSAAAVGSVDNVSVIEVTAEDASYADMCMQTGASTYEWVNIVRNTY